VKAFIDQAIGIVEQIRPLAAGRGSSFAARIEADCAHMLQRLEPLLRTSLLSSVGQMRRLPAESMVLQRRRGYREVFRHFIRMRMATRIPTGADPRALLELEDIAALYELWCFFEVQRAVTQLLGPPSVAQTPVATALQLYLPCDLRIASTTYGSPAPTPGARRCIGRPRASPCSSPRRFVGTCPSRSRRARCAARSTCRRTAS
jgi:hypothetical protein